MRATNTATLIGGSDILFEGATTDDPAPYGGTLGRARDPPDTVAHVADEYRSMRAQLPAPVEDPVAKIRNPLMQIEFPYLLANAKFLEPVLVDAETAARMVRPYRWFLDRAGTEGIKLTSTGYLPPADVEAASAELGLADEWIGSSTARCRPPPSWTSASR
jgi:hypothetical protein